MNNFNYNCSYSTMLRGETKPSLEDLIESLPTYWGLLISEINAKAKENGKEIISKYSIYLNSSDRVIELFDDIYIAVDYYGDIELIAYDIKVTAEQLEICAEFVKRTEDYLEL